MQVSSKNLIKTVSAVSLASQEVDRLSNQVKDMKIKYSEIKELKSSKSANHRDITTQIDNELAVENNITINKDKDDNIMLNKSIGLSIDGQTSTDQLSHVGNIYSAQNSVKHQNIILQGDNRYVNELNLNIPVNG